jgi:septum formation protein
MTLLHLILASGSPQRHTLLAEAGYEFEVVVPHDAAECGMCSTGGPAGMVAELAFRKAADVAYQLREKNEKQSALLIACDTLAECNGSILGKPRDEQHARQMLTLLSGQVHRVYSGLCLWPLLENRNESTPETQIAVTELRMDELSEEQLDEYLASGLWQGKAGAFGYQDRIDWLHIEQGSESNVIGLPMELLAEMLVPWKTRLADGLDL